MIIPCKRPSNTVDTSRYIENLPCTHCFGLFRDKDLWRHVQKCHAQANKGGSSHQAAGRMLLPIGKEISEAFKRNILSTMTNDDIACIIQRDALILQFGERVFNKCANQPHQHGYVKQKVRELGRFLKCMKLENVHVKNLKDCIDPAKFRQVTGAVRKLCKYETETCKFGTPSLALKIGHSLNKCASHLKSSALQMNDENLKRQATEFMELYSSDWASEVSTMALRTLYNKKFNQGNKIPLAQDLQLLNTHLQEKACETMEQVEHETSQEAWRELNEVTLAQLVLFNRRRGGEVERIQLACYMEGIARKNEMQEEVAAGLTNFEKSLAASLLRLEIRGKRGRRVPVLLTKKHKTQIDCLLAHRAVAGVEHDNQFLFPRCGDTKCSLRSSDVLRKFSISCGAQEPSLITSTSLRKHVATISQILNLKKNELDSLADFLGHDIQVHRNFYRLPEDTIQLAKVSKILVELEKGNISKYSGKSLDEINAEDDYDQDEIDCSDPEQNCEDMLDSGSVDQCENMEAEGTTQSSSHSTTEITCSVGSKRGTRIRKAAPKISRTSEEKTVKETTPSSSRSRTEITCSVGNKGGSRIRKAAPKIPSSEETTAKENTPSSSSSNIVGNKGRSRKAAPKIPWTSEEKAAVERRLGKFLRLERLPGKADCEEAKRKEPVLHRRPWSQIKFCIKNTKTSEIRKLSGPRQNSD